MRHLDKIQHAKLIDAKIELLNPTERKLYRLVAVSGTRGRTCEELVTSTGWVHQSVGARLSEMRRVGLVARSGLFRPTARKRQAHVLLAITEDA